MLSIVLSILGALTYLTNTTVNYQKETKTLAVKCNIDGWEMHRKQSLVCWQ